MNTNAYHLIKCGESIQYFSLQCLKADIHLQNYLTDGNERLAN